MGSFSGDFDPKLETPPPDDIPYPTRLKETPAGTTIAAGVIFDHGRRVAWASSYSSAEPPTIKKWTVSRDLLVEVMA